jgi:hypothetical protein
LPFWNTNLYNDSRWLAAAELGRLGETAPWDVRENVEGAATAEVRAERFKIAEEFTVERLLDGARVGSLIARRMARCC